MNTSIYMVINMPFAERLAALRKERHSTQEQLGNQIGLTKAQIYRYEKGTSQPTLPAIRKLAIALSVTTDQLIFETGERQPDGNLSLLLEGVSKLDPDEKHVIQEMVEGILLKHQAKLLIKTKRSI